MNLNELTKEIHANAVAHGWWDEPQPFPVIAALIHSEISEALEEWRYGRPLLWYEKKSEATLYADENPCIKAELHKPQGLAVELADAIIRVLDYCGYAGIDIEKAIRLKHEYNKGRPYRHGGKRA